MHFAATKLLCLEMTHMKMGGKVFTVQFLKDCRALCDKHGAKMHLDGARFFNACVALDLPPKDIAQYFDTIAVCFSKGLGSV